MTNTRLLKELIDKSGLKMNFIAEYVGLSRQGLWQKINNKTPFNQFEIEKLCTLLRIKKLTDKEAIFFAVDVD